MRAELLTMVSVVGYGWRSRGLGSLGMRSSGSTWTCGWGSRCGLSLSLRGCSHSHLPLAGTEVEIEAALKPLLNEPRVARDLPQTAVPGEWGTEGEANIDRRLTFWGGNLVSLPPPLPPTGSPVHTQPVVMVAGGGDLPQWGWGGTQEEGCKTHCGQGEGAWGPGCACGAWHHSRQSEQEVSHPPHTWLVYLTCSPSPHNM